MSFLSVRTTTWQKVANAFGYEAEELVTGLWRLKACSARTIGFVHMFSDQNWGT